MTRKRPAAKAKIFVQNILLIPVLFVLMACDTQSVNIPKSAQRVKVTSLQLKQQQGFEVPKQYVAEVKANHSTALAFEQSGKLQRLIVDSGDYVQKNQLLALLNTEILKTELEQLTASMKQVEAELALAKATLSRQNKLHNQSFVSEQQFDERAKQVTRLVAEKEKWQAMINAAHLKIRKANIYAPFSGQISNRFQSEGNIVSAGVKVYELIGIGDMQLHLQVAPKDIFQFDPNDHYLFSIKGQSYSAKLVGISQSISPTTRTHEVRFSLPDNTHLPQAELAYLNRNATVKQSGFWVPVSALTHGVRGLWNVLYLTPDENDQYVVARRDVEIIFSNKNSAYITGALEHGDRIVASGAHKLISGQKVLLSPISKGNDNEAAK
ncbi:MAG: efflux RND transporter periplasmic adaptor subunit [Parashewanella sp.]